MFSIFTCVMSRVTDSEPGLPMDFKAAFTRQTCVGKLKLICVKGTKTVGKQVGKLLATNRTCLYSRQLFCVGKLESDV